VKTTTALLAASALLAVLSSEVGHANETFDFTFTGSQAKDDNPIAALGGSGPAIEKGYATVGNFQIKGGGGGGPSAYPVVSASVTVTGAGSGDGVFGPSDYANSFITFWSVAPLDLSKQLVGQPVSDGCTYAQSDCFSGDFNIFDGQNGAPLAFSPFTQLAGGDGQIFDDQTFGNTLQLTSLTVSAPEPSTWAMLTLGFAGLGLAGYHRRSGRVAPSIA
jgi:hypothetical protein